MADIFISYKRQDLDFADKLVRALEDDERSVWIDRQIRAGAEFPDEIANEIDAAAVVLFVISPESVVSDWCLREIAYARENHKRIIPLQYRLVDAEQLPPAVATVQSIDFTHEDHFAAAFATLQHALDTDLAAEREGALLLIRAREWEAKSRQVGFLTGKELNDAEHWQAIAAAANVSPTELHMRYITSSRRRQATRLRWVIAGLSLMLVILLTLTGLSFTLSQTVQTRNVEITHQRDAALLALEANNAETNGQFDLALLLAAEANHLDDSLLTRDALLSSLTAYPSLRTMLHLGLSSLYDAVLSHDGATLAMIGTSSDDSEQAIELANVRNPAHITIGAAIPLPRSANFPQPSLTFTPDDSLLIALVSIANQTRMVAVSMARGGAIVRTFAPPASMWSLQSLVAVSNTHVYASLCPYSPDSFGGIVYCPGLLFNLFEWNLADGAFVGALAPFASTSDLMIVGSPDGQTLVTGACGTSCASLQLQEWSLVSVSKIGRPVAVSLGVASPSTGIGSLIAPSFVFSSDSAYGLLYTNCDSLPGLLSCSNRQQLTQLFHVTPQGLQSASALTSFADVSAVEGAAILPGKTPQVVFEQNGLGSDGHGRIFVWDPSSFPSSSDLPDQDARIVADNLVGRTFLSSPADLLVSLDGTTLFSTYGFNSVLTWDLTGTSAMHQQLSGVGSTDRDLGRRLDTGTILWRDARQDLMTSTTSANIDTQLLWNDQGAQVIDNATHTTLGYLPNATPGDSLLLSADGRYAAQVAQVGQPVGQQKTIPVWDVASRTLITTLGDTAAGYISAAVFSPTTDLLVYSQGADLSGWDPQTHHLRFHIHRTGADIEDLAFSGDGHTIATIDSTGSIWLWDASQGEPVRQLQDAIIPQLDRTNTNEVVFSGDGRLLASRTGTTVTLWDVASATPLFHVQAASSGILLFDPTGNNLLVVTDSEFVQGASSAYSVRIVSSSWQTMACQEAGRSFTREEWQHYLPGQPYAPVCPST